MDSFNKHHADLQTGIPRHMMDLIPRLGAYYWGRTTGAYYWGLTAGAYYYLGRRLRLWGVVEGTGGVIYVNAQANTLNGNMRTAIDRHIIRWEDTGNSKMWMKHK